MACVVYIEENLIQKKLAQAPWDKVWFLILCINVPLQKQLLMLIERKLYFAGILLACHNKIFELFPWDIENLSAVIFGTN